MMMVVMMTILLTKKRRMDMKLYKKYVMPYLSAFILGPIFILSISVLTVMLGVFIFKKIADKISWKRINKKTKEYLLNADSTKTALIREFRADETHTLSLPMNDGLIIELNSLGIISMAGNTQMTGPRFDGQLEVRYFLQPRIISIIDNNPELKKKYKRK